MAVRKIVNIGDRFNRLTILEEVAPVYKYARIFRCKCDCGTVSVFRLSNLTNGHSKSCGCYNIESLKKKRVHGMSYTTEYKSYRKMLERCYDTKEVGYHNYGGRGISVCERWRHSFNNFIEDMGMKPTPSHSIERINTDGNYEPSNCKWVTSLEQNRNRRRHAWHEHNGIRMIREDWAKYFKVHPSMINTHMSRGKTFAQVFDFYENKNKQNGF